MKSVYIKTTTIEITLTNGNTIVKDDYNPLGFMRYMYQYGEVPSDTATEYNDTDKILTLGDSDFGQRIYKDEVKSFVVRYNYKIITNPSIKRLQSDLDFYTYSQLVFDREHELKGMLNKSD